MAPFFSFLYSGKLFSQEKTGANPGETSMVRKR